MPAATVDIVALYRRLARQTQKSGMPSHREVASSEDFFEARGGPAALYRRMEKARAKFDDRFARMRESLEEELGRSREHRQDRENRTAMWTDVETEVRLVLAHEDKESPYVITLHVERRPGAISDDRPIGDAPTARRRAPAAGCACKKLVTTRDPFTGTPRVLVSKNRALHDTHVRVAEAKRAGAKVRLYRCGACGQLRQSGKLGSEYVFEVPPIDSEEWQREPYVDAQEWELYETRLRDYFERADRTTTDHVCRVEGCRSNAVRLSVFCFEHHLVGRPEPPPGRPIR